MSLLRIAWRNLLNRPLNTMLTLILLGFGVGIISLLLLIQVQLSDQFNRNIKDIDMVLGAKGSPLQLILANVYHIDAPTGKIKISDAQKVLKNRFLKLYIEEAIPLAYGDYYMNYRIVGTDSVYPKHYSMALAEGSLFHAPFEATFGSKVAKSSGLKVGDTFLSTHGQDQKSDTPDELVHSHADKPYTVVGIFEQSGSVLDQLILTPLESTWIIHEKHDHGGETAHEHDHDEEHSDHHDTASQEPIDSTHVGHGSEEHVHEGEEGHDDEDEREVTAYLIKERESPDKANGEHKASQLQMMVPKMITDIPIMAAEPAIEINRLTEGFGIGMGAATVIALIIMFISFVSVFVSLYNSLKDRKYELALLRTMGGTRGTLFRLITLEGLLMTLVGFIFGILLGRVALYFLSQILEDKFNYSMARLQPLPGEYILLGITLFVGILASFLPAIRALRMDISKTLANG